jgi:hypothetical protein
MTLEDLAKKTKEELLTLAREMKIKNRSKMTKNELIENLKTTKVQSDAKAEAQIKAAALPKQPPEPIYGSGLAKAETHAPTRAEETRFPLPTTYNVTKIALLIRDPFWLYTYWDLSPEAKAQLKNDYGDWEKAPLSLRICEEKESGGADPHLFHVSINPSTSNWYLNVQPNHYYTAELGYFSPAGDFIILARSNTVITPRATFSQVIDEEWMIIEEDFRRLYRMAGDPQASSAELGGGLLKRLEKEMGSAAVSSLSSPFGQPPADRRFWLVLNTELIVYGATEPNAVLTLDGQPVTLRPDGSFTARFALPDGKKSIPVTACSQDGNDEITITPVVTKETY